jgi:hypothetical protein
MNENQSALDILDLDLEYRLTVGLRMADGDETCVKYLIDRREILLPEILKIAKAKGEDPADIFHAYQKKVHARHENKES